MTPDRSTQHAHFTLRTKEDAVVDRYVRFYPALALGTLALAFLPLFNDVTSNEGSTTLRVTYGTVFDMASRPGGGPAVIGVLLLFGLVALLAGATLRPPRSAGLPTAMAVVAVLIVLLLITKPATGTPKPHLSDSGTAGFILVICAAVLGAAHALHLTALAKRAGEEAP